MKQNKKDYTIRDRKKRRKDDAGMKGAEKN
jgi:hypothetical protein